MSGIWCTFYYIMQRICSLFCGAHKQRTNNPILRTPESPNWTRTLFLERTMINRFFIIDAIYYRFGSFLSGGYAFFETSQLPDSPKAQNTVSAMMSSPELQSTGSEGFCVTFRYTWSNDNNNVVLPGWPQNHEPLNVFLAALGVTAYKWQARPWLSSVATP
jgi:hypothetical protein